MTGSQDWPANATATVELWYSENDSNQTLRNESLTIEDDRWRATFDLSDVEVGTTFVARLRRDSEVVGTVEGTVGNESANVRFDNQTVTGSPPTAIVQRVHLEAGGFVIIHDNSTTGPVVGVSEYLPPGTHENVTVPLKTSFSPPWDLVAVAHRDTDCDEEFERVTQDEDDAYYKAFAQDNPGADPATVRLSTATPPPSPTEPRTPSEEPGPETDTSSGIGTGAASKSPAATGTSSSGLGIVTALVTVVGVTLAIRRRE